jgi:hypothetical protein
MLALPTHASAQAGKDFNQRLLDRHNLERQAMGVPPLAWRSDLAEDAGKWAKHLAATNRFDHAPQPDSDKAQGENLWQGTKSDYTPEEMVQLWIDEKSDYVRAPFPKVSRTGNWLDVGHYTQLIWYRTTHVGCAVATGKEDEVLVCRYAPAGNWIGEDPQGRPVMKRHSSKRKRP